MEKQKIILDLDNATGIPARDVDDGLTLAMALASPELELLGITTCAGNCRTHESTRNTLSMLELAGRQDIPVAAGRELPFIQDVSASFDYLDGWTRTYSSMWEGVPRLPEPKTEPVDLKAHEFIIEMVKKYPGEIIIVKEGSHSNLALALLAEPELASQVKAVVHMGGDIGEPWWSDTSSAAAENDDPDVWRRIVRMNHTYDPEATEIVVRSGIPFTFVTSKVCAKVLLRLEDLDAIQAGGTPFHQFIADVSRPWINWQLEVRGREGAVMWDPLTLAVVIDPDFCTFANMRCDLERFRNWEFPWLYPSADTPQVSVTMDVEAERFERFFVERLASPMTEATA